MFPEGVVYQGEFKDGHLAAIGKIFENEDFMGEWEQEKGTENIILKHYSKEGELLV